MSRVLKTGERDFHFAKTYQQLKDIRYLEKHNTSLIFGPWRIRPGGLSVSRTFGDVQSKYDNKNKSEQIGIVTCEPEVHEMELDDIDFVFLGCDGVYDSLSNKEIVDTIWGTLRY